MVRRDVTRCYRNVLTVTRSVTHNDTLYNAALRQLGMRMNGTCAKAVPVMPVPQHLIVICSSLIRYNDAGNTKLILYLAKVTLNLAYKVFRVI